jgi:YegS/Rv2252/BmrU family lipid kinase
VFNPVARGDKARRFRAEIDRLAANCVLKPTQHPRHAADLAAEAAREGADVIVAAGGDGTVNEVVDGLARDPAVLDRVRLGVIPLGTINVFARDLGLPSSLAGAWATIRAGREVRVDLPWAESAADGVTVRRRFAQLGGAGVDARAIELVDWDLKKRFGPLAYVWAGAQALRGDKPCVRAICDEGEAAGELVLIGNGRFYGGSIPMFPEGDLSNGRLEIRVFPRVNLATLTRFSWAWLWDCGFKVPGETRFQTTHVRLSADRPVAFELDGDLAGHLPADFGIQPTALRVLAPKPSSRA